MNTYLRIALIVVALGLPMVSLAGLGVLWLWQTGYMIPWAIAASAVTLIVYGLEVWVLRPAKSERRGDKTDLRLSADDVDNEGRSAPSSDWTPAEQKAWTAVQAIAGAVDISKLVDRQAFVDLGYQTVDTVARSLHPEEADPLLRFTVPEALALVERVASRLRPAVIDHVPLGDQVTVGQAMKLYNWSSMIGVAEKAYDIWRVVRLMNPVTAVTQEMREKVTKRFYNWGRDALGRRMARAYVEEVGRAAIELYSGRLKVLPDELATSRASQRDLDHVEAARADIEPLRILLAGQRGAGKSSLVNAMSDEVLAQVDQLAETAAFTPYRLERDGVPAALLLDSPGLSAIPGETDALTNEAADADLIIWVCNATRADREPDRAALDAIRDRFLRDPHRRPPRVLVVVAHIDKLRPFGEWAPPYSLDATATGKAATIKAAAAAVAEDLGVAPEDVVPACLEQAVGRFNIDAIWAQIHAYLPEAKAAQLVRRLGEASQGFSWGRLWAQTRNAGRAIRGNLTG